MNALSTEMEDVWISSFVLSGQKNLVLNQQQSMKNLTIGINALIDISVLELSGLEALERVGVIESN